MSARADALVETLGAKDYRERVKRRQPMLAGLDWHGLKREIFAARQRRSDRRDARLSHQAPGIVVVDIDSTLAAG
jgi:hypothetical protein